MAKYQITFADGEAFTVTSSTYSGAAWEALSQRYGRDTSIGMSRRSKQVQKLKRISGAYDQPGDFQKTLYDAPDGPAFHVAELPPTADDVAQIQEAYTALVTQMLRDAAALLGETQRYNLLTVTNEVTVRRLEGLCGDILAVTSDLHHLADELEKEEGV